MLKFENPQFFLWAIPLAALLLFWSWKSYAGLGRGRRYLATGLRALGLLAILAGLARPVLFLPAEDEAVIYLLDISDSVEDSALEVALAHVAQATTELESHQAAALVVFAGQPRLQRTLDKKPIAPKDQSLQSILHRKNRTLFQGALQSIETAESPDAEALSAAQENLARIEDWRTSMQIERTDTAAALRLARSLIPVEARGRLVLFTDGNHNRGQVGRELRALRESGITVNTHTPPPSERLEVLAQSIEMPAEVHVKQPFNLTVHIVANQETTANVTLFRNGYRIASREMQLKVGSNPLRMERLTLDEGFYSYEAIVEAQGDTRLENNAVRGAVKVAGKPKVLLVERQPGASRFLIEALESQGLSVEERPAAGAPSDLRDLLNYDALILSDLPSEHFRPGAMEAVKTYVREMGGGLIMIGGEKSFGLGGYYRTPIEDALPVRMPIKKNIEKPNLSLVLVIDKSGSMGGHKIGLAKEAAIASSEVLKDHDRFGVVAFDGRAEWVSPITSAADRTSIQNNIARLSAGGGTNIYPGLHKAYKALLEEDSKIRHVILLSDGQTQGSGYDTLVGHLTAEGMTLSTIGIGDGADQEFLERLSSQGGGEAYFTNDFASIPQIFTRETMRASKAMIVEEPFVPTVGTSSDSLKGVRDEDIPFLMGYVATQAKQRAEVALISDYGDPVLATWNYGLGRSAAFTSDAKARWASDWISWEGFGKFWGQLVRSVMNTGTSSDLQTMSRIEVQGGVAKIYQDVRDRSGAFRSDVTPKITLMKPNGERIDLPSEAQGPGLFAAEFPIEKYGEAHHLVLSYELDGQVISMKTLSLTESYSPEYAELLPDPAALTRIAKDTGGQENALAPTDFVFQGDPAQAPQDTFRWWLLAALCLLPLDIALRRLGA